ncbi:twin-arginine translocation signal domain-containing protein [Sphingomonas tabacisoli]|uniref:Twin-arginine translocation signal domain-containing protein n=1 Tax=Sphingomonas tabacisoli TaxID=2249466 RepID=A0ABW4I6Y0_9SPHN
MNRRDFLYASAASTILAGAGVRAQSYSTVPVTIHTRQVTGPLNHIWEESVGSDRAAITLRESWRRDLEKGVREAGFKRVRFHGIFADELGVLGDSILEMRRKGGPNWQNVYRVYDGLIEHSVSPFVELSFMPAQLASGKQAFGFYKANITPPKSYQDYGAFIRQFIVALVDRYGLAKVRTWPMEVWNEPNLRFFWTGDQASYFELYRAAATAIKSVDPGLQVGGPSTSQTAWLSEFSRFAADNNLPINFFGTHAYAGDNQTELFGKGSALPINDVIPAALKQARAKIDAGPFAGRPLMLSEWSSDSPAMIAHVVKESMPFAQALSHWVLSGTYEELGPDDFILKEGSMGWPLMSDQIARPSFNTYALLHRLGEERLAADGPALASRRDGRHVSALVWNLAETQQPGGIPGMTSERNVMGDTRHLEVNFRGTRGGQRVRISYVDWERGSPMPAWRKMGSPKYPSRPQVEQLRLASKIPSIAGSLDKNGRITVELPPEGVALIEFV